jgi:hypothetical protein
MPRARLQLIAIAGALVSLPLAPDAATSSAPLVSRVVEQFLSRNHEPRQYRALRRLEAGAGADRAGWLEAWTEFTPGVGFRYGIVSEGGAESVRSRVLRAVLHREKELADRGSALIAAIEPANYVMEPGGFDPAGLVKLLLRPRRKDDLLLDGAMFLTPREGDLVRVEGRLVKSPSFWIRKVDVVRHYRRVQGLRLPVMVESTAQVRFIGPASFRMTYRYTEVDRRPIS